MPFDLFHNWPLKLSCLGLAMLVWILTTGESQRIKEILVPVEYTNLAEGMEISGEVPDQISVRFQAPELILQRITEENIDARVDLSELSAGDQFLAISRDRFRVPGATLVRVEPELIPIRIVRRLEKEVPVQPRIEGKPPPGYEMVDYRVEPESVVVIGPEDAVQRVQRATTGSILVDRFTSSQDVSVHAIAEAAGDRRVRLKNPDGMVKVGISIRETPIQKLLRDIPVLSMGTEFVVHSEPEKINVRVEGPPSLLKSFGKENLAVLIDLSGLSPRRRAYQVTPRQSLVGISPDRSSEFKIVSTPPSVEVQVSPQQQEIP